MFGTCLVHYMFDTCLVHVWYMFGTCLIHKLVKCTFKPNKPEFGSQPLIFLIFSASVHHGGAGCHIEEAY